ncbi:MAG: transcription termination/antitermination protein NusA, partial [Alphaproteobacteria bacterium]|nr:transcription termination/antitermination protein NusA [Alphaproteobacteria bacterium]
AEALQARAYDYLERRDAEYDAERREMGVEDALAAIEGLTPAMLVTLGEAGIKNLDDLGDLASDELTDRESGFLRDFALSDEEANTIIMAARAHWFDDEEAAAPAAPAEAASAEAEIGAAEDGA